MLCPPNSCYSPFHPFIYALNLMFLKLLRSIILGLIVAGILLVALPCSAAQVIYSLEKAIT